MADYDISVIIPMYNVESFIGECIESVLAQTKDKIEIVVVNDGSTDGSRDILRSYTEKHENIVCVDKENGGLASARIAGLQHASGKYIGWVDADDFIEPTMFEKLYALIVENGADLVYCRQKFYPKKPKNKEIWFKEYHGRRDWDFIERNSQPSHFCASAELLRAIDICALFEEFGEYGWIAVMLNAKKIAYTDECLYYYRVGHASMSGSGNGNGGFVGKVQKLVAGAEKSLHLKAILKGTPYEKELAPYFDYRYIYSLFLVEIVAAINADKAAYKDAAEKLRAMSFRKNPYTKLILDHNHGKLKSFVVRNVVASSYTAARAVTSIVF